MPSDEAPPLDDADASAVLVLPAVVTVAPFPDGVPAGLAFPADPVTPATVGPKALVVVVGPAVMMIDR